jgi:O-antigen/teichoic acid export membrane protein
VARSIDAGEDGLASRHGAVRTILSGLGWNTGAQVAVTGLNVVTTPLLLSRLGVDAYGVFALVSSFRGLLSNLDGGLGPCATRYLAVYAGAGDRRAMTSLIATTSLMALVVVAPIVGLVALVAPDIVVVLHAAPELRREAIVLIRLFMVLLLVSTIRGIAMRAISAEHRWSYLSIWSTVATAVYLGLGVGLVFAGAGLVGLFWASVAGEVVMVAITLLGLRGVLEARHLRLMARPQVREIVAYASRVQVAEIASSLGNEFNAIVVGLMFPVRFVTYYSVGTNFATQLNGLPANALGPIAITLSRTFGRRGLHRTVEVFTSIQRLWVRATCAWPLIGAVAAYFGIVAWLGPKERLAAIVAAVVLTGQAPWLLAMVMDGFLKSANHPGLESKYLGLATAIDMALAAPLAFGLGMLGVPIGVAAGYIVASFYLLHLARRDVDPGLRSFFADVPAGAVLSGVLVTFLLEVPAAHLAPRGALGLIVCGLPALAGLGTYALAAAGPDRLKWEARRVLAFARGSADAFTGSLRPDETAVTLSSTATSSTSTVLDEDDAVATMGSQLDEMLASCRRRGTGSLLLVLIELLPPDDGTCRLTGEELEDAAIAVLETIRDGDFVMPLGSAMLAVALGLDGGRGRFADAAEQDVLAIERRLKASAGRRTRDASFRTISLLVPIATQESGVEILRSALSRLGSR